MTVLNFLLTDEAVYVLTDTLLSDPDDLSPITFATKIHALPHLQALICGTGHTSSRHSGRGPGRPRAFLGQVIWACYDALTRLRLRPTRRVAAVTPVKKPSQLARTQIIHQACTAER